MPSTYTYLLLLIGSLLYPLAQSFEHRLRYYRRMPALLPGLLVTAVVFIGWDIFFALYDIWSFNNEYVLGLYVWGLPLEEWAFFIVIPYCCFFIYEVVHYFFARFYQPLFAQVVTYILLICCVAAVVFFYNRYYTLVCCGLAALMLLWQLVRRTHQTYLSKFYLAYFICLIPFGVVNGILTSFPVVMYNNAHNLAFRIGTIPVEDFVYLLAMLLMTANIYEARLKR